MATSSAAGTDFGLPLSLAGALGRLSEQDLAALLRDHRRGAELLRTRLELVRTQSELAELHKHARGLNRKIFNLAHEVS